MAQMCAARERPGGKGGTRYQDMKMLCADPSLREPFNQVAAIIVQRAEQYGLSVRFTPLWIGDYTIGG